MPVFPPGVVYLLAVGDTDISARYCHYVNSTFHLEFMRTLVFLIKLPSFLKQIFHIYHFLEEEHFYKKNLVGEKNWILLDKKRPDKPIFFYDIERIYPFITTTF